MHYPSQIRSERIADAVVHVLGVSGAFGAGATLLGYSIGNLDRSVILACVLYVVAMFASKLVSALYHLHPHDHWRPLLRRLDHALIYGLIAGTFTPLLVYIGTTWSLMVLAAVWALSMPAMIYKIVANEIEPRWSLWSYLGIAWIGAFALPEFAEFLPVSATIAALSGGLIYTAGTFFYARKKQAYRYAIWHTFVLAGTAAFFIAVWSTMMSPVHA